MTQWFRTPVALALDPGWSSAQHVNGSLQLTVIPVQGDLVPYSDPNIYSDKHTHKP